MPEPEHSALHLHEVTIVRGGRHLLDGVDLGIGRGEYWALVGPNGAGKSTLLRLAGARLYPSRGQAHVLGERLGRVEIARLHARIGNIDPRHDIRSNMPVRTVVATGLTGTVERRLHWAPSPEQEEIVEGLLAAMGLRERADHRWPHLSQGERGRALVARALAARPELLLLDEPTTGLDLAARERFLDTLGHLGEIAPGVTTVHITHALEELPEVTTHAALMSRGRIVAAGPVGEVLTSAGLSAAFEHPVRVEHRDGRWSARTAR